MTYLISPSWSLIRLIPGWRSWQMEASLVTPLRWPDLTECPLQLPVLRCIWVWCGQRILALIWVSGVISAVSPQAGHGLQLRVTARVRQLPQLESSLNQLLSLPTLILHSLQWLPVLLALRVFSIKSTPALQVVTLRKSPPTYMWHLFILGPSLIHK